MTDARLKAEQLAAEKYPIGLADEVRHPVLDDARQQGYVSGYLAALTEKLGADDE